MPTKTAQLLLLGIIAIVFLAGTLFYPSLPDRIVTHWNAAGEADGYSGAFFGVFIIPIMMILMYLIYLVIPRIDPLRKNIEAFRKYYDGFWIFLFLLLLYVFGLQLSWNLGVKFDFIRAMIPAFAIFWYIIGIILEHSKRNWFFGIRTPWTLSNDEVWERTHVLGGKLFKIAGALMLFGLLFRDAYALLLIVIPAMVIAIVTIVYSYLEYKKIAKR